MNASTVELSTSDLNAQLERWIDQRTSGRVRSLRVENDRGRVVVRGHTGSYYVRQLALAAVMEVLEGGRSEQVELDIEVGPGSSVHSGRTAHSPSRAWPILAGVQQHFAHA